MHSNTRRVDSNAEALAGDIDKLHKKVIGLPGVLYFCLVGPAPISAMLFNFLCSSGIITLFCSRKGDALHR
jgi:hypothetical protein